MLALANRLRQDGIDALVDQYNPAPFEGWPHWMTREIQITDFVLLVCTETYRRRVEGQEEPGKGRGVLWEAKLIYNLLHRQDAKVQRFIPILFADGQSSSIPLPLEGLAHYWVDTERGYEDLLRHLTNQPRHLKPKLGKPPSLPPKEPQSYPSSPAAKPDPKPPTNLDQRHRRQLLKQMRLDWIEGVLNQSLYKVARLELGLINKTDAVEQPLNAVVQVPDRSPTPILPGTRISQIFDEQAGALLILGAPGTGKTTFLLELAKDLLDRADRDESQPIPVVFPLSSWAARRQPLAEWLTAELNQRSYVPKKVARQWVEAEQILPLLDGLDEVTAEHREACVDAINQFRREYGLLPIAVCSRITDYESLGTKLRLRTAVEVQPLAKHQVEEYLARVGEPLRGLRSALEKDASLWELLETPLMLWVAMLAYQKLSLVSLPGDNLEQRQLFLFAYFVEAMFRWKPRMKIYTPKQTKHCLSWLARVLMKNSQTVFYLENIDFNWLPKHTQRWLARAGVFLVVGLLFGLFIGLTVELKNRLLFGLLGGLLSIMVKIQPAEKARFDRLNWSSRIRTALRSGLLTGLIFGLLFGLFVGLKEGMEYSLNNGLVFGISSGLVSATVRLFTSEAIPETRSTPNQGTHSSIGIAAIYGLLSRAE